MELITLNLALAVAGCATAVRRFLASGSPGAIVPVTLPVTSHRGQMPPARVCLTVLPAPRRS